MQSAVPQWGEDFIISQGLWSLALLLHFPTSYPLPPPAALTSQLGEDSEFVKIVTAYKRQYDEGLEKI